jgi:uncharacterized protein YjbI with pentapeptide repeats
MIEVKHKQTGKVLLRFDAVSLEGASLTGVNLAGANLTGAKINHACLRNVDLQGAVLDRAQLIGACLDSANLTQASLDAADLTDASLQQADLSRAHLVEATMRYAKLSGANFLQAKMAGANLSMADARANLRGADLQSADLRGANLTGANLHEANLFQADLSGATITRATISGAQMQGAKMAGVINDEVASRVEAATRASTMRRDPAGITNGFQLGGRVIVRCPFCIQQQEIPPQRVEHHSRCVACKQRFFVDRMGNASEPRVAKANQWTPELSSDSLNPSSASDWKWPDWLTKPLLGAAAVLLLGIGLGYGISAVRGPPYVLPDGLQPRAEFVAAAIVAEDVARLRAVTARDTFSDIYEWLKVTRVGGWTHSGEYANPRFRSLVLFEDAKQGRAGVLCELIDDGPAESAKAIGPELLTFWKRSSDGSWLLDARSSRLGTMSSE